MADYDVPIAIVAEVAFKRRKNGKSINLVRVRWQGDSFDSTDDTFEDRFIWRRDHAVLYAKYEDDLPNWTLELATTQATSELKGRKQMVGPISKFFTWNPAHISFRGPKSGRLITIPLVCLKSQRGEGSGREWGGVAWSGVVEWSGVEWLTGLSHVKSIISYSLPIRESPGRKKKQRNF